MLDGGGLVACLFDIRDRAGMTSYPTYVVCLLYMGYSVSLPLSKVEYCL